MTSGGRSLHGGFTPTWDPRAGGVQRGSDFPQIVFPHFRCKDLLPEKRDFSRVPLELACNYCASHAQTVEIFWQTRQLTMNNKNQNHATARPVARLDELKPSVSTVAAHKNGRMSTGHCGRRFPNAFSVCGTPLPVCFQAGFHFGGQIDGETERRFVPFELSLLKTN